MASSPITEMPGIFDPSGVGQIRVVDYPKVQEAAYTYKRKHGIKHISQDQERTALILVDNQITFCNSTHGELPVAGAEADCRRLCEFIYRECGNITEIVATMDSHRSMQIFHPCFLIDDNGAHPGPADNPIMLDAILAGKWRVNPELAYTLANGDVAFLERHLTHYAGKLAQSDKAALMIWPYHAMLGGIGHALEPSIAEAAFFWGRARGGEVNFDIKGLHPLTEYYSVLCPEVTTTIDSHGAEVALPGAQWNTRTLERLSKFDRVIIAGEAKSHCVAWTIDNLLGWLMTKDPELVKKVYLLEDCTSPVVIPGVIDFTASANAAFDKFKAKGCHVVNSTTPMMNW